MQLSRKCEELLAAWVARDKLDKEQWFDFINQYVADHGLEPIDEPELREMIEAKAKEIELPLEIRSEDMIAEWVSGYTHLMTSILDFLRHTNRS